MQARYGIQLVFLEREEEQHRDEALSASAFLLSLCAACAHFTVVPPNAI